MEKEKEIDMCVFLDEILSGKILIVRGYILPQPLLITPTPSYPWSI